MPSPLPFVGDGTFPTDKQTISNIQEVDLFLQDSVGPEGNIGYDGEGVGIDDGEERDEFEDATSSLNVASDTVSKFPNAPAQTTFNCWNTIGCKFISLATGGLIYILVLIAGLDMWWKITTLGDHIPWEVEKMLRQLERCIVEVMIVIRDDGHISMDHRVNPSYLYYTIHAVDQALHGIPGVTVIWMTFDHEHPNNHKFPAETN
ncbi:hypothetical protein BDR06DRAFT_973631 [Suillus hirtellus]|nr:hypothetical protein BDR06DRAFT_973631 [Suillus hirtellus]